MLTEDLLQKSIIHQQNTSYLHLFKSDIAGLTPKTIKRHLQNVDFFLNTYLVVDESNPLTMEECVTAIDDFWDISWKRKLTLQIAPNAALLLVCVSFINLCLNMGKSLLSSMKM